MKKRGQVWGVQFGGFQDMDASFQGLGFVPGSSVPKAQSYLSPGWSKCELREHLRNPG